MTQDMQRCPNCGAYVMSNDDYCPRCDHRLDEPAPERETDRAELITEVVAAVSDTALDPVPAADLDDQTEQHSTDLADPTEQHSMDQHDQDEQNETDQGDHDHADDQDDPPTPTPKKYLPTARPLFAKSAKIEESDKVEVVMPPSESDLAVLASPILEVQLADPVESAEDDAALGDLIFIDDTISADDTVANEPPHEDHPTSDPAGDDAAVDDADEAAVTDEGAAPDLDTLDEDAAPDDNAPVEEATEEAAEEAVNDDVLDDDPLDDTDEINIPALMEALAHDPVTDTESDAEVQNDPMDLTHPAIRLQAQRHADRYIVPPAPYTPPPPVYAPPAYASPPVQTPPPTIAFVRQRVEEYRRGGYRLHSHRPDEAILSYGKRLGAVRWFLALVSVVGALWYLLLLALSGFQRDHVYIVLESDGYVYEDGPGAAHIRRQRARIGRRWATFGLMILVVALLLAIILGIVAGLVLTQDRYQAALREAYPAVTLFEEQFSATEATSDDVQLAKDGAVAFSILGGIALVGLWGGATLFVIGTIHAGAYRVHVNALPGWD